MNVRCILLCSRPKGQRNQLKPVQLSRQQALRTYCPNIYTVKLGNKERFDKEQIGIKELFMDYQGPKKGLTDAAIMLCKLNKSL